jgi:hypothetical protein
MRPLANWLGLDEEEQDPYIAQTGGHEAEMPSLAEMPAPDARTSGPIVPAAPPAEQQQVRYETPAERRAKPPASPPMQASGVSGGGEWRPDFMGALAAFTRNPVLMQQVQARDARRAAAPDLALKKAKEAREAEEFALRKPTIAAQARSKEAYAAKTEQDTQANAAKMDAASDLSRSFVESAASALSSKAQLLAAKFPDIAERLWTAAKGLAGKSYEEAKAAVAALGPVATQALEEAQRQTANKYRERGLGLQGAALAETKRYHDMSDANADAGRIEAHLTKPQEKLNSQIEDLSGTEELLNEVKDRKKDVDTGWFMNKVNKARQWAGIPDKNYDTMEALLAAVDNEIIKLQAGGNVTAGEAVRMKQQLAMVDQNDPEFEAKLDAMLKNVGMKKRRKINQYQRNASGGTIDASNTARANTGQPAVGAPAPGAMKAPPGAQPGQTIRQKSTGKTFLVQADGTMQEVQ